MTVKAPIGLQNKEAPRVEAEFISQTTASLAFQVINGTRSVDSYCKEIDKYHEKQIGRN